MYKIVVDSENTFSQVPDKDGKEKTDYATPFNSNNRSIYWGVYDPQTKEYKYYNLLKDDITPLKELIENKVEMIIGQNIKYDVNWLTKIGIETRHLIQDDTLVREYVLRGGKDTYGKLGLDKLAPVYGGTTKIDIIKKMWKAGINIDKCDEGVITAYLRGDVWNTWRVWLGQEQHKNRKRFDSMLNMKRELNATVQRMEYNGLNVNVETAKKSQKAFEGYVAEAEINMSDLLSKHVAPKELIIVPSNLPLDDKAKFKKNYEDNDDVVLFDGGSPVDKMEFLYGLRLKSKETLFKEANIDLGETHIVTKKPTKAHPEGREVEELVWRTQTIINSKYSKLRKANLEKWQQGIKRCKTRSRLDQLISECMEKAEYGFGAKPLPHKFILGKAGLSAGKDAINTLLMKTQSKRATAYMEAVNDINAKKVWVTSNIAPMIYKRTDDGKVHCSFNVAGTISGRFSSSDPNIQNLPSKKKHKGLNDVRRCVESRFGKDGVIVAIDYSQLELRYVMEVTKCQQGISDYKNGVDLHTSTAKAVYENIHGDGSYDKADDYTKGEWRGAAKIVNFGILYGDFPTDDVGKQLYDAFFERYPEVTDWHNQIEDSVMFHQYYQHPLTGWMYDFKGANSENMWRGYTAKGGGWRNNARNLPVQGGSNEVIQIASIKVDEDIKYRDDMFLIAQVHDELVFDCKKEKLDTCLEIGYKHMQNNISQHFQSYFGKELEIPFVVEAEAGENWFEMKEV